VPVYGPQPVAARLPEARPLMNADGSLASVSALAAIGWKLVDKIGPFSPHGLGIAIGYVAGGSLGAARAERLYAIKKDHIWNALMWAVVGVIIGSRLFYVAGHLGDYFPDDILGIVRIWEGGIVFYGGAIGGIIAGVPYLRRHGIPFWHAMDSIAPGFPLGLLIGRIGDLVIGDHLGGPTSFFLGYRYDGGALPPGCAVPGDPSPTVSCPAIGGVVHQTALYDWLNVLIVFPVVLWAGRKRRPDGSLFMFMASWYALGRLVSDFARPATTYGGLRGTQWVSVAIIAYGLYRIAGVGWRALEPLPATEPPAAVPQERPGSGWSEQQAWSEEVRAWSAEARAWAAKERRAGGTEETTHSEAEDMIAEGGPATPPAFREATDDEPGDPAG